MEKLKGSIKAFNVYHTDAYMIAVKNGFEGTEAEWLESLKLSPEETEKAVNNYLRENPVAVDETLTVSGEGADAKVTGEKFAELQAKSEENKTAVNTHAENKENPHGVTAEQVGARPSDWMPTVEEVGATPASHAENKNNPHGVTAAQVGARPNTWMPTAFEVGARPSNWTPTAADVGAVTEAQVSTMINNALGVIENGTY